MSDNGRLPAISGVYQEAQSSRGGGGGTRDIPQAPTDAHMASAKFNAVLQQLAEISFPTLNSELSIKGRIINLETCTNAQADFNNSAVRSFDQLNNSLLSAEDGMKMLLKHIQDEFDAKLAVVKKEYDHRFDLQNSENKRLQNHVATLKADTKVLKTKLQSTIEKLRKLQHEFGDPDGDFEEESSVLFSTTGSLSRPNTTGGAM